MIRLAPLITADVDTTTLPGGKASDAAQDFLALLSEALTGEATTDKATPQLLVATDKPTAKGEPLVSDIVSDAHQADLLIPVDETLPVINDEQSTSTPLTTAQTITLAAAADNNTAKDEKADDLNEDVTASLSALFAMLPGFDNTPKVTDAPSTVLPTEKPTLFTKLTSAQLTTAQPDDAPGTPAQPLTPLVAEAQSKAEIISTPSPQDRCRQPANHSTPDTATAHRRRACFECTAGFSRMATIIKPAYFAVHPPGATKCRVASAPAGFR